MPNTLAWLRGINVVYAPSVRFRRERVYSIRQDPISMQSGLPPFPGAAAAGRKYSQWKVRYLPLGATTLLPR